MFVANNGENIISTKKILYNIKHYIWVVLICLAAAFVVVTVMSLKDNKKGDTVIVNTLLQAQQNGVEISEGITVTALSVGQEFKIYIETEAVREFLNDQLKGMGYTPLDSDDEIDLVVTGNAIELSVQGKNSERTQYLSQLIIQELVDYYKSDGMFSGVRLIDSSVKEINGGSFWNSLISVKNMFILMLGVVFGSCVLFLIICFDQKIYVKEDIFHIENLKYLITIEKKNWEQGARELKEISRHYKSSGQITIMALKEEKKEFFIENVKTVLFDEWIEKSGEKEAGEEKLIVKFRIGKDKKNVIEKAMAYLSSLDIKPIGYILVEE